VWSFLSNEACFAGHMWPAGQGLSTTVLRRSCCIEGIKTLYVDKVPVCVWQIKNFVCPTKNTHTPRTSQKKATINFCPPAICNALKWSVVVEEDLNAVLLPIASVVKEVIGLMFTPTLECLFRTVSLFPVTLSARFRRNQSNKRANELVN